MLPKYNAFQLKLFMAILMVFDHIDHIPGLLPIELAGVFHVLTRCVGVFFSRSTASATPTTASAMFCVCSSGRPSWRPATPFTT